MASILSRAEARKVAAGRHARRGETCPCGRAVFGNGRISHFRACPVYLREKGWPFTQTEQQALLEVVLESLDDELAPAQRVAEINRMMDEAAMREARRRGLVTGA